jgi:hypothetical protein
VRVTPADPFAAPLTFIFSDFPGVNLRAGLTYRTHVPPCGCDACDENWEQGADELEFTVQAVVGGTFTERVTGRFKPKMMHLLEVPGLGIRGSEGLPDADVTPAELAAVRAHFRTIGAWKRWPLRASER